MKEGDDIRQPPFTIRTSVLQTGLGEVCNIRGRIM